MSHVELPLRDRKLWATGDVLLWADLDVHVKDNAGQWKADTFLVDSESGLMALRRRPQCTGI
jgi:hypothetical protein